MFWDVYPESNIEVGRSTFYTIKSERDDRAYFFKGFLHHFIHIFSSHKSAVVPYSPGMVSFAP